MKRVYLRCWVAGWALAVLPAAGCEQPLFPAELSRTPYDRYQHLHGHRRSMTEENAYGGQQPALRERLRPLEQR